MVLATKIEKSIKIPEGVTVEINKGTVKVTGPKGVVEEKFKLGKIRIESKNNKIVVGVHFPKKKEKALIGTISSKIRNMIVGVTKGYKYKLRVLYSHFPINVSVDGNKVIIKNFLGEKYPRICEIVGDAKVEVKGQDITITGAKKEDVGQTAANLIEGTKIRKRDPRVFKDGIFLVEKGVIESEET